MDVTGRRPTGATVAAEKLQHRPQHQSGSIDVDMVARTGNLHQPRIGNRRDDFEGALVGEQCALFPA
jgi:hypothetical protein